MFICIKEKPGAEINYELPYIYFLGKVGYVIFHLCLEIMLTNYMVNFRRPFHFLWLFFS